MLHGEVKINNVVIGEWSAIRRKGPVGEQFRTYDCWLEYRGTDGYMYEATWVIWGEGHMNGAISLAARVLREGMTKAERVENTTLKDDALDVMSRALNG